MQQLIVEFGYCCRSDNYRQEDQHHVTIVTFFPVLEIYAFHAIRNILFDYGLSICAFSITRTISNSLLSYFHFGCKLDYLH
jgi:hypothetical protein